MRMTKIVTAHATNCDRMRLPVVHANPERMRVLKVIENCWSIYRPILRLRRNLVVKPQLAHQRALELPHGGAKRRPLAPCRKAKWQGEKDVRTRATSVLHGGRSAGEIGYFSGHSVLRIHRIANCAQRHILEKPCSAAHVSLTRMLFSTTQILK